MRLKRANFAANFNDDWITLDRARDGALGFRVFAREHYSQAWTALIFERADIDANNIGDGKQVFIVRRQDDIDIAARSWRTTLCHVPGWKRENGAKQTET